MDENVWCDEPDSDPVINQMRRGRGIGVGGGGGGICDRLNFFFLSFCLSASLRSAEYSHGAVF